MKTSLDMPLSMLRWARRSRLLTCQHISNGTGIDNQRLSKIRDGSAKATDYEIHLLALFFNLKDDSMRELLPAIHQESLVYLGLKPPTR